MSSPGYGGKHVLARSIEDGLSSKSQAVQVELSDPIDGIGGEELPNGPRARSVKVESLTPVVLVPIGEIVL
jgi:hypothetical protein